MHQKTKNLLKHILLLIFCFIFWYFVAGGYKYLYHMVPNTYLHIYSHIGRIDQQSTMVFYLSRFAMVIAQILLSLFVLRFAGFAAKDVGLTWQVNSINDKFGFKKSVFSGIMIVFVFGLVLWAGGLVGVQAQFITPSMKTWDFFATMIAPFAEEFFFRGVFFALFARYFGDKITIIIAATFFGLLHKLIFPWPMVAWITFMGLYFGWLYAKTKSLLLPVLAHLFANIICQFLRITVG